jgi:hypothetical protein
MPSATLGKKQGIEMKLSKLSNEAADGLVKWAEYEHQDSLFFDGIGSLPAEWAWVHFQLKVAEDRPEWFPKGKWATIQAIEMFLTAEAYEAKWRPPR